MSNWVEILGYIASFFIAFSLLMKNVVKLRVINLFGGILFLTYGIILGIVPVILLNIFNSFVNLYFLYQVFKEEEHFELVSADFGKEKILSRFIDFYKKDISKHAPGLLRGEFDHYHAALILRDLCPAGLFVYDIKDEFIDILVHYVAPEYRDFQNSRFFYDQKVQEFKARGIKYVRILNTDRVYAKYLLKNGFKPVIEDDKTIMIRNI